eukprot:4287037-Amphidinium_carterae.3
MSMLNLATPQEVQGFASDAHATAGLTTQQLATIRHRVSSLGVPESEMSLDKQVNVYMKISALLKANGSGGKQSRCSFNAKTI